MVGDNSRDRDPVRRLLVTGAAGMLGHRVVADARARGWDAIGVDLARRRPHRPRRRAGPRRGARARRRRPLRGVHRRRRRRGRRGRRAGRQRRRRRPTSPPPRRCSARASSPSPPTTSSTARSPTAPTSSPTRPRRSAPTGARSSRASSAIAGHDPNHAIARTAWLFGVGGKNFCDTMLTPPPTRDEVAVVTDQIGSPTWTGHLSPALLDLAAADAVGVFHTAGGGQCSWHELTVELYRAAGVDCRVNETTAAEFQRPAPRPAWSVLATERDETPRLPAWQDGVAQYLSERNGRREAARLRRGRVHRLELRPPARARPRRRGRRARQADLRRPPENLEDLGVTLVHGAIEDAEKVAEAIGDGVDAIVNFAAETHVDRSISGPDAFVETNVRGTLRAAGGRARARGHALRADLDRRGLRLDRGGLVHRGVADRPVLALQRDEGRRRPARAVLLPHLRAGDRDLPRLQQLRALPVPREADPADGAQRAARRQAAGLRRRAQRAQLALRRGLRPRDLPRPGPRRARRGLQRRRPRRGHQHRGRQGHPRRTRARTSP